MHAGQNTTNSNASICYWVQGKLVDFTVWLHAEWVGILEQTASATCHVCVMYIHNAFILTHAPPGKWWHALRPAYTHMLIDIKTPFCTADPPGPSPAPPTRAAASASATRLNAKQGKFSSRRIENTCGQSQAPGK